MTVHHSPALSTQAIDAATEARLFAQLATGGEQGAEARHRIILAHMGLVKMVVRSYVRPGLNPHDLIQEGALGVMRALETYDSSRGLRFSTYAVHWVRAFLQSFVRGCMRQWNPLMPGVAPQPHPSGHNRIPRTTAVSMDTPLDEESRSAGELVPHQDPTPDMVFDMVEERRRVRRALLDATQELGDPRAEVILKHRLLTEDPDTLAQVSRRLGLSREGARLIEQRILKSARRMVVDEPAAQAA